MFPQQTHKGKQRKKKKNYNSPTSKSKQKPKQNATSKTTLNPIQFTFEFILWKRKNKPQMKEQDKKEEL